MASIKVRGYSERGMINAVSYEIMYSNNSIQIFKDFLQLCIFPFSKPNFENIQKAKIRIEQSFSDFGDLDLLILLDGNPQQSILLEAKVKTYQSNNWSISSEWANFKQQSAAKNYPSNLFIQLYRKMRLIQKVQNPNERLSADIFGSRWSLGENAIVKKAAAELASYASEAWFVALVPDSQQNLVQFIKNEFSNPPQNLPSWKSTKFGYLTWADLENHCRKYPDDWKETLANFDYNQGQIYGTRLYLPPNDSTTEPPPPGTIVLWKSGLGQKFVIITNRGHHKARVTLPNGDEEVVPNGQLEALPSDFDKGKIPLFQHKKDDLPHPPKTKVLWRIDSYHELIVTIKNRGRRNTRVILEGGNERVVPDNELFPLRKF